MNVILNQPELASNTNRYYKDMLANLVDDHIYDNGKFAVGYKTPKAGPVMNVAEQGTLIGNGIAPGTYFYVITAMLGTLETVASVEAEVVVDAFHNLVHLVWTAVPGATAYRIYRTTISGNYDNSLIQQVGSGSTSFNDVGFGATAGTPPVFQILVTGSVTPPAAYQVDLFLSNKQNDFQQIASVDTDINGNFSFVFTPMYSMNELYAVVGGTRSESIFVNTYNLHLFFEMIADDMRANWQSALERAWHTPQLFPIQNLFDSNTSESSLSDFKDAWGVLTSVVDHPALNGQYRQFVQAIISTYKKATTFQALLDIFFMYQAGISKKLRIVPYDVYNKSFQLGGQTTNTPLKFFVTRPVVGNPSLTYNWIGGTVFLNGERGYIPNGSMTVADPTQGWTFVYVDGTRDVNGYFNVKALDQASGAFLLADGLPDDVLVLAVIITNHVDDIIHIAGQGRIASVSSPFKGIGTGPYKCGPTFIADSARLNGRKYKYSRILMFFGNVITPVDAVLLDSIKALLKDVKPAKMTILFGTNLSPTFEEI